MNGTAGQLRETILVVDDNATNLRFLQEILRPHYKVHAAPSGERALQFLSGSHLPDLVLLDIEMPGMDGYEVITRLKADLRWNEIPVIFLTAQEGRDKEQQALQLGAVDFILKPISAGIVLSRVRLHIELEMYKKNLERLVRQKTAQLERMQDSILEMLTNVTAYRDNETGAHIKRTTFFVERLSRHLMEQDHPGYPISTEYAQDMTKSSKLHDIGKIGVPDRILLKPGKLTREEFEIIKHHAELGGQLLAEAIEDLGDTTTFLNVAMEIALSHHEWWDGTGYPLGLRGPEIPISGRVMAVADVYDALISRRLYKEPYTHQKAVETIMAEAGTHFDPVLLELCHPVFDDFPAIAEQYKDEHYQKKLYQ